MTGDLRERPVREEAVPWLAAAVEMLKESLGLAVRAPASISNRVFFFFLLSGFCFLSVLVREGGRGFFLFEIDHDGEKKKRQQWF